MKKIIVIGLLAAALGYQSSVIASNDSKLDAIADIGELNGIALQCRYVEQMQRIKRALVVNLPKKRELGSWFEEKTNNSFMDFMAKGSSCPEQAIFETQVGIAIERIEMEFKVEK